jgi:hypothetical protein
MLVIIENTPRWVFAVFFVTLYYCIIACYRREIDVNKLLLFPGVFIGLSLWSIFQYNEPGKMLFIWGVGFICSSIATFHFVSKVLITPGKKDKTISIPGTSSVLIVFLIYFSVRYYVGYEEAIRGIQGINSVQLIITALASGLTVGFYTGRALRIYLRYREFLTTSVES